MNANTMTLRVYKNEYEPKQIAFIATQFDVVFESESMLTISGTPDDLERVMSAMFCNEEQFKTIFPKFITEAERQGIEPDNCPISADLSAVLGSLEYFIQEHDCTA